MAPDTQLTEVPLFDYDQMVDVDGLDWFNMLDFGVAFNQWLF